MAKNKKYTVAGPHKVLGTAVGESVTLDPSEPQTVRLLARGQLVPASSRPNPDGAPTEDDPVSPASDESEEK